MSITTYESNIELDSSKSPLNQYIKRSFSLCGSLVAEIPNLSTIRLRAVPTFRLRPSCPKTQWKKMMLAHSAEVYFSCASAPRVLRGVLTSLFFFRVTVSGLRWSKLFPYTCQQPLHHVFPKEEPIRVVEICPLRHICLGVRAQESQKHVMTSRHKGTQKRKQFHNW